jgi:hypothetical protein
VPVTELLGEGEGVGDGVEVPAAELLGEGEGVGDGV